MLCTCRRRLFFFTISILFVAIVAIHLFGDSICFALDKCTSRSRYSVGSHLRRNHGLILHTSFDERLPFEWCGSTPMEVSGAKSVLGVFGNARKFNGGVENFITSSILWSGIPQSGGSLTMMLKLTNTGRDQIIVADQISYGYISLALRNGKMRFSAIADGVPVAVEYDFKSFKKFIHLAVVMESGRCSIYENGHLMASAQCGRNFFFLQRPICFNTENRFPLKGIVDEFSVWNRPLSPKEVSALAKSWYPLVWNLEPVRCFVAYSFATVEKAFLMSLRIVDRLKPSLCKPAMIDIGIRPLDITMSDADARYFIHSHEACLVSGFRLPNAGRERSVSISVEHLTEHAEMFLDNVYHRRTVQARPSFVVRARPGFLSSDSGMVRIFPPEEYGENHPDRIFPLPLDQSELVRLFINGEFKGFYCLENFDRRGSAWMIFGKRDVNRKDSVFFSSQPGTLADCCTAGDIDTKKLFRDMISLLAGDIHFKWSCSEAMFRMRKQILRRNAGLFADSKLTELDLLGNNRSAFFITGNLDLSAAGVAEWRSSDESLIAASGRVTRPDGDVPKVVELTADFQNGEQRVFRFRVMPEKFRLPVMMLYVNDMLEKNTKKDFACVYYPAGGGMKVSLFGVTGENGGLKHRGNTSYVKSAKRSMSLEFDKNCFTNALVCGKHMKLLCGYADASRLRNKLAYNTFNLMRDTADGHATTPEVGWTEVFVNDEYFGVWEMCGRPEDISTPQARMFRANARSDIFGHVSVDMLEQTKPNFKERNCFGTVLDLMRFTANSSSEDFSKDVANVFDMDNIINFFILLNFTGNEDGRVTNLYLSKEDGKFYFIPWDYDKTFIPGKALTLLDNALLRRCVAEYPNFKTIVTDRWCKLRCDKLTDAALLRWIEKQSAIIAPYMDEEYRLSPPLGWDGDYYSAVRSLGEEVINRLHVMDKRFPQKP